MINSSPPSLFFQTQDWNPKIKVWCTAIWYAHIYSFWVSHCWNLSNWKQKIDSWAVCQPTTHCHACINCWKLEQNMSCALPSSTYKYVACITQICTMHLEPWWYTYVIGPFNTINMVMHQFKKITTVETMLSFLTSTQRNTDQVVLFISYFYFFLALCLCASTYYLLNTEVFLLSQILSWCCNFTNCDKQILLEFTISFLFFL